MGGACSTHEINAYKISVGKPEETAPRHRSIWEGNIRMDRRKIVWERVEWIHLAQDMDQWRALVNTVMNLRVP
jgi:hypothetical protein